MLDRVVMDVIHVRKQISFIAHRMFPKPPLPYVVFTLGDFDGSERPPP